jgi:cell division protein FtsZ
MFERFYNRTLRRFFGSRFTGDARIAVVGVGGGGGNVVNNMVQKGIEGVDFIAVNTDSQVLATNKADRCIQVGKEATGGLGAGARPEVGVDAVEESRDVIERAIEPYDMVFVTAGMGGGTGTGGAPVLASIAQELGILTVGIVTRPFRCEGPRRQRIADEGIEQLREEADTLLVIPNERLLDLANDGTSLEEAFWMADEVLYDATRGIVNLITYEGLINLDFADVDRTMRNGGTALLGISTQYNMRQHRTPRGKAQTTDGGQNGTGETTSRPEEAAVEAISSPLFDGRSIRGADKVLVNVTGGPSLGFREAMSVMEVIQAEAGENCEVIFGAVTDESIEGQFQVTVIATGLDEEQTADRAIQVPSQELDQIKAANSHVNEDDSVPVTAENGRE